MKSGRTKPSKIVPNTFYYLQGMIKMGKCGKCGEEQLVPFICNYCGGKFCSEHRIPEHHDCLKRLGPKLDYYSQQKKFTNPPSNVTVQNSKSASSINSNYEELVNYALNLINNDRKTQNLQKVCLSSICSGQIHAEDMLRNHYFSHWNTNGYKPCMRYTLVGGQGAVTENIAWEGKYGSSLILDVKTAIKGLEYKMMYDDASSNWGHRDNILNPMHNKVSIGIAYDGNNVFFVEDFEDAYIDWYSLKVKNNQVTMQGKILDPQLKIQSVGIFYDAPLPLTTKQLWNPPYHDQYDPGTPVGLVLPENWKAKGIPTLTADAWDQNKNSFHICFSLSQAITAHGKGVYTLYVQIGKSTASSLTTYSIWIK
jgi:uncharacterized protein YkwD